jgi:ATP-binding cassette subfamily F protein 3
MAALAVTAKKQQAQADKLDEYVRRFMNSERTAQARGRLKHLQKLEANKVSAPKNEKAMKTSFAPSKRSGDVVLDFKAVQFGYTDVPLLRDVSWTVRNGERWGVVGENGAGKSTLVKLGLGILTPDAGTARLGSNVVLGYFAQDVATLDESMSPIDVLVWEYDLTPGDARNLLGRFLLSGDDVFRPIRTLSGGEKNKLVLATLTTLHPNFLVLDEPTNHLDMASREALAEVLIEYKGTLVLISHDRWLLGKVTDHTLDVRTKGVISYAGPYSNAPRSVEQPKVVLPKSDERVAPALSPRDLSKEIVRLEREVERIEAEIAKAEATIVQQESSLATIGPDDDVFALSVAHGESIAHRDALMEEWSNLVESLELHRDMR